MFATEERQITPRQAFTMELLGTIRNLITEDIKILIAGDFNTIDDNSGIPRQLQR
jgi:acylphosphatase